MHLALDFVDAAELSDETRPGIQVNIGARRGWKLKGPETGDPESAAISRRCSRCDDESAGLREQLDEDDRRHHRLPRKMSLEEEVVRARDAARCGPFAGDDLDDFLDEPHRRLVRQRFDGVHRGLLYTSDLAGGL